MRFLGDIRKNCNGKLPAPIIPEIHCHQETHYRDRKFKKCRHFLSIPAGK